MSLVIARKPRRRDGGRGRHPGVPLDAYFARAAAPSRRLQMGGHAREYARSTVALTVVLPENLLSYYLERTFINTQLFFRHLGIIKTKSPKTFVAGQSFLFRNYIK